MNISENKIISLLNTYKTIHNIYINDEHKTNFINKKIDKIYIINLEKDTIRRRYIECVMKKYGINIELIICI
jgi:hypothetical protein